MFELTFKRSIILRSGEIVPAGSILNNEMLLLQKSIAPSLIIGGKKKNQCVRNNISHTF